MKNKILDILSYLFAVITISSLSVHLLTNKEIYGLSLFSLALFFITNYINKKTNKHFLIVSTILIICGWIEIIINL